MKVFYSPDYVAAAYGFDTTRKAGWVADSLHDRPIPGVELVGPQAATFGDLRRVHSIEYITAVRTGKDRDLAESQGFTWDKGLYKAAAASTGGMLDAALTALDDGIAGTLSSGLHHARKNYGEGFCTFNGLALAAKAALLRRGVDKVLIVDFDAHCGGGTADILRHDSRVWQADVSTSRFDLYYSNLLEIVTHADDYLNACQVMLDKLTTQSWDLVLYNAGMDPFEGCDVGGLDGVTYDMLAAREDMVFDYFAGTPIAWTLAGGYVGEDLSQDQLVDLHRLTISAALS